MQINSFEHVVFTSNIDACLCGASMGVSVIVCIKCEMGNREYFFLSDISAYKENQLNK